MTEQAWSPAAEMPFHGSADAQSGVSDEVLTIGWRVRPERASGEWLLEVFEIGSGGQEQLLAEVGLDPDGTVQMVSGLHAAYQDMTGQPITADPAEFSGPTADQDEHWWTRATTGLTFRTAVFALIGVFVLIAFVVNIFR